MRNLLSINVNQLFKATNDEETEFEKFHELVLLCDEADYAYSTERAVVRNRKITAFPVVVPHKHLDSLIEMLQNLKDAKPSDLT